MSRQVLEVTMHLPDGVVRKGWGRNLPSIMERLYNQACNPKPARHMRLIDGLNLKTGHLKSGELRYEGTYNIQFGLSKGDSANRSGNVTVEVTSVKPAKV